MSLFEHTDRFELGMTVRPGPVNDAYDRINSAFDQVEGLLSKRLTFSQPMPVFNVPVEGYKDGMLGFDSEGRPAFISKAYLEQLEQQAAASASAASASETNAAASEASAQAHKVAAASSAVEAASSEAAAQASETNAAASEVAANNHKNNAAASATAAETHKDTAATKAVEATTKAAEASASAATADNHRILSEQAKNAAETAKTASENAKTAAEIARDNAKSSEIAVEADRVTVQGYKNTAQAYSEQAVTKADEAAASATGAAASELEASNQATIATTKAGEASASASEAATSEAEAEQWADYGEDLVIPGTVDKHSAKHHAAKAAASQLAASVSEANSAASEVNAQLHKTAAEDSENAAANSELKAQQWADNPSNAVIPGTTDKYSAKHWALWAEAKVAGTLLYKGIWNPADGEPPAPVKGHYYRISGFGNFGGIDWDNGDSAIHNGTGWDRIAGSDTVTSVNGYVGQVTLTAADVGALDSTAGGTVAGPVSFSDDVVFYRKRLTFHDAGLGNRDYIYHDDDANTFHFVSDSAYDTDGKDSSSLLQARGYTTSRCRLEYGRLLIDGKKAIEGWGSDNTLRINTSNEFGTTIIGSQLIVDGQVWADALTVGGLPALKRGDYGLGDSAINESVDWDAISDTSFFRGSGALNMPPSRHVWAYGIQIEHNDSYNMQLGKGYFSDDALYHRTKVTGVTQPWVKVYDELNPPPLPTYGDIQPITNDANPSSGDLIYVGTPGGAMMSLDASNQTGAIKITLPVSWTNHMMQMVVDVFNYSGSLENESYIRFYIGGYNYASTTSWQGLCVDQHGGSKAYNVRFDHDGTHCFILIGDTTDVWGCPKVLVRDFAYGYSTRDEALHSGWKIEMDAVTGSAKPPFANRVYDQSFKPTDLIYDDEIILEGNDSGRLILRNNMGGSGVSHKSLLEIDNFNPSISLQDRSTSEQSRVMQLQRHGEAFRLFMADSADPAQNPNMYLEMKPSANLWQMGGKDVIRKGDYGLGHIAAYPDDVGELGNDWNGIGGKSGFFMANNATNGIDGVDWQYGINVAHGNVGWDWTITTGFNQGEPIAHRKHINGTWVDYVKIYDELNPPTPNEVGAAPVVHSHDRVTWNDAFTREYAVSYVPNAYFTAGEYIKICQITPAQNSRNYAVSGEFHVFVGQYCFACDFHMAVRSNVLPAVGLLLHYTPRPYSSAIHNDHIKPYVCRDTSSGSVILAFKVADNYAASGYHSADAKFRIYQRGEYDSDIVVFDGEAGSEVTTVPAGFEEIEGVEQDTWGKLNNLYDLGFGAEQSSINSNWNAIDRSGFYTNQANSQPEIPMSVNQLQLIHIESGSYATQLCMRGAKDNPASWRRTRAAGAWGDWVMLYDTAHKPTAADVQALPAAGGNLAGAINYVGSMDSPILSINGKTAIKALTAGGGLQIGCDESLFIGGGEAAATMSANLSRTDERTSIGSDHYIDFYTNIQSGWENRKRFLMRNDGILEVPDAVQIGAVGNNAYHPNNKPSPEDIGAAPSSHAHSELTNLLNLNLNKTPGNDVVEENADISSYNKIGQAVYTDLEHANTVNGPSGQTGKAFVASMGAGTESGKLYQLLATESGKHYFTVDGGASWNRFYSNNDMPTLTELGAAPSAHTHPYSPENHGHSDLENKTLTSVYTGSSTEVKMSAYGDGQYLVFCGTSSSASATKGYGIIQYWTNASSDMYGGGGVDSSGRCWSLLIQNPSSGFTAQRSVLKANLYDLASGANAGNLRILEIYRIT